jgi:hypothetical protein
VRPSLATVTYLPEFGRPVSIREFDRPMLSDDHETAQTVSYMDELASADSNDRAVIAATAEALQQAGIDERADPLEKACAVYWWLKRTIRYVPTPGTSQLVDQTLITPTALLAMEEPIGDCPQFSMLAAAMFRVLCMDSLFVTIAAEPAFPDQWSHIYNTVEVCPGQYLPFDSSNGPAPGAEYAKPFKRRVWPRITPGKCRTKEGGTDMMRSAYGRPGRVGMRNHSLRGTIGDLACDQDGNCFDTSTGETLTTSGDAPDPSTLPSPLGTNFPATLAANAAALNPPAGSLSPLPANPTSSNVLTTLFNDLAQVATPIVKAATTPQPYYITNAQGQQVLYNPATGQVVSSLSTISPTMLVIGAGLLIGVLALSGKK